MNNEQEKQIHLRACPNCGGAILDDDEWCTTVVCQPCRRLYPPSLLKAAVDPFDYALRLKTGEIIQFNSAELHGDYVTLSANGLCRDEDDFRDDNPEMPFPFARGLEVRLDQIVWCADAPNGS